MKMFKKCAAGVVFSLMLAGCLTNHAAAAETEPKEVTITGTIQMDLADFPSNEELFADYAEVVLYDLQENVEFYGDVGESKLQTEESKQVYRLLKEMAGQVADGERASSEMVLENCFSWTAQELGVDKITGENINDLMIAQLAKIDINSIFNYLLMDCPYNLYWFDKTITCETACSFSYYPDKLMMSYTLKMPVSVDFAVEGGGIYDVDTTVTKGVVTAKNKAQSIVDANKGASAYEKLCAYKEAVCELTSYNYKALENMATTPYGNPWQLVWVFDENPNTEVVCEGYAKAFQYLCDLSDLKCYTVTGNLSWGTGAGAHMWNIVPIDGKNYLVDLTNCDSGTVGYPDKLFLKGAVGGTVAQGYTFAADYDVTFSYFEEQILYLGEEVLTLSEENYTVKEEPATKPVTEIFVDVAKDAWFVDAVQFVYDRGIIVGNGNEFTPYGDTTRAMVATILWRMEGAPAVTDYSKYNEFKDLPKTHLWYSEAVAWALNEEVATGDDYHKLYNPDASVTREQLAVFLWRYMQYKNEDVTVERTADEILGGTYVNSWAREGFAWAVDRGIIKGSESIGANGQIQYDLMPQNGSTRAQFATVLQRIIGKD